MTDVATHTTATPTRSSRPLPIPLARESERAAVERVLIQDPQMRPLLEELTKEVPKYFPDCKGLELAVDGDCEEWLVVVLYRDQHSVGLLESEARFDQEWFTRNRRRVDGRLFLSVLYA